MFQRGKGTIFDAGLRLATASPSALRLAIASVAQPEGHTEAVRACRQLALHLREGRDYCVQCLAHKWSSCCLPLSKPGARAEESLVALRAEKGEEFCRKRPHQVRGRDAEDTSGKNKVRIVKAYKDEQVLWLSFDSV